MRVEGGKATDNTQALYVQDELALLDPLYLTAGLRLTRNQGFGTRLTPKISAMLKLGELRLRATWSQGYKTPTPKELHYQYVRNMNGVYLYLGNENLKAQTSNYFGVSAEYTIGHLTLTLAPYYNKVKDMITLVTIPTKDAPGDLITKYDPIRVPTAISTQRPISMTLRRNRWSRLPSTVWPITKPICMSHGTTISRSVISWA